MVLDLGIIKCQDIAQKSLLDSALLRDLTKEGQNKLNMFMYSVSKLKLTFSSKENSN
jgi:hypothetical protein